jgi:hypothetical protein
MNKNFPILLMTFIFLDMMWFSAVAHGEQVISLSNQPQLFLDDYLIAKMINVRRALNPPVKHPANPVIVQDQPWEKRMLEIYGTVLYDEQMKKFKCWYLGSESPTAIPDTPEAPGTAEYYQCYAESDDGVHWIKPMIGYSPFGLHPKTNVVIKGGSGFCVMYCPDEADPQKRYKGAGGNIFGFSPDGIHWTTQKWEAVGKNDTSTSFVFWKGEYLAFVRNQEKDDRPKGNLQRAVGICVSKDFVNWTPKKTVFMTDAKDGHPWVQPYGLSATVYGDVLIGLVPMLHLDKTAGNNSLGDMDVQMLVSRDGRKWERAADRAVFLNGRKGDWDWRVMFPATSMMVKDDIVYIYYSGATARHGDKTSRCITGIGLATLPADRFVVVQAEKPDTEAILETHPLEFTGGELILNAVQSESLKVELIDPQGQVIKGFDRNTCKLTKHDDLRYRVSWATPEGEKNLGQARRNNLSALRFVLTNPAKLFAFTVR